MPILSKQEQSSFLHERGIIMRLAVVRSDGSPLLAPVWFLHENGRIYFTPREHSEWFSCLKLDSRISLCIDEATLPYRKIIMEGNAELAFDIGEDAEWRDLYGRIVRRYISPEEANAYIRNTIDQPRALYSLQLLESKIKSWRMPSAGEDPSGIWHRKYYKKGSKYSKLVN
tara:strand:- start:153 stop:665 length:513 start_codon:yes stop_codon:yes gene_type:complete